MVLPTLKTFLFLKRFSLFKLIISKYVGTNKMSESLSINLLLISSGMLSSNDLSPASIWIILILSLLFLNFLLWIEHARHPAIAVFVSPCTIKYFGFSLIKIFSTSFKVFEKKFANELLVALILYFGLGILKKLKNTSLIILV